jgi:hypothetical protein
VTGAEADRLLARAREVGNDPFMKRMIEEDDARRYGPERAARRAEIARLSEELGCAPHPMISR